MSEELKPCPFCGGRAEKDAYDRGIFIGCTSCGYRRSFGGLLQPTPDPKNRPGGTKPVRKGGEIKEYYHMNAHEDAAKAWNSRIETALATDKQ